MLLTLYFFVVGAILGSFSLVLAWRMHDKKDWVKSRSKCDSCGHILDAKDLIPILSWVSLGGRCRYCKKPIPKTVIGAELLLGAILALSWAFWPYQVNNFSGYSLFGLWVLICTTMSALFWYDLRWFLLPNKLVYTLLPLSILFVLNKNFLIGFNFRDGLLMPVLSVVFLSGLFFVLYVYSKGRWIGFGDVRLGYSLGLLLGSPLNSWLMLFISSVLGVLVALPSLFSGKRKLTSKIPFGPLLIIASIIVVLFGSELIERYIILMEL